MSIVVKVNGQDRPKEESPWDMEEPHSGSCIPSAGSQRTVSQDENEGVRRSGPIGHAKAFGFNLRASRNPLEDFRQCQGII